MLSEQARFRVWPIEYSRAMSKVATVDRHLRDGAPRE
ncbi:hypothetical protein Poly41_47150 [Novipirellula artificiosorum]|uniref:Uncharacterized protein n=1 Tax=Novipirellula artificiosorum TaxID=2528016 RepID=A0A5C6DFI1_9BACT|nr:hypothetical protein Poly41_47150 [Novipirellula artificiosorum]